MASLLFGFKQISGPKYPCYHCGVITNLIDAEHFSVCAEHQREYAEIGHEAMREKYPLAGKDERNPEFFKAETERHIRRARRLKPRHLKLLMKRGCTPDREHAQALLDGKPLAQHEMEWVGRSAEQYLQPWEMF